jgi:hypothetical protein
VIDLRSVFRILLNVLGILIITTGALASLWLGFSVTKELFGWIGVVLGIFIFPLVACVGTIAYGFLSGYWLPPAGILELIIGGYLIIRAGRMLE